MVLSRVEDMDTTRNNYNIYGVLKRFIQNNLAHLRKGTSDRWTASKTTATVAQTCSICGNVHPDEPYWSDLPTLDNRRKISFIAPIDIEETNCATTSLTNSSYHHNWPSNLTMLHCFECGGPHWNIYRMSHRSKMLREFIKVIKLWPIEEVWSSNPRTRHQMRSVLSVLW